MVLTGFLRALPGDHACLSPSPTDMFLSKPGRADSNSAHLTPASGRQDHTTSPYAATSLVRTLLIAHRPFANPPCDPVARKTLPRPPHPHPASVTIAIRPSGGVGCESCRFDLGQVATNFLRKIRKTDSTALSTNRPTGKSLAGFRTPRVKPLFGKYSAFAVGQISDLNPPVSPDKRGGSRSSRNARWDAVDADALLTNGADRVRRRRVVLTPRCWRQVGGNYLADDGGNKAGHRGEHEGNRKTIAQGMPDCLR